MTWRSKFLEEPSWSQEETAALEKQLPLRDKRGEQPAVGPLHPVASLQPLYPGESACVTSRLGRAWLAWPGVLDSNLMMIGTSASFLSCALSFHLKVDRASDWRSLSSMLN